MATQDEFDKSLIPGNQHPMVTGAPPKPAVPAPVATAAPSPGNTFPGNRLQGNSGASGAPAPAPSAPPTPAPATAPVAAPASVAGTAPKPDIAQPPQFDAKQIASDRAAAGNAWNVFKDWNDNAGRAIADVGSLVPRALVGAYDSAVVRPMRAMGADASYLSPKLVPDGVDPSSMTPFMDQKRMTEAVTTAPKPALATGQIPLPAGVTPSTAGGGRGSVNPPMADPTKPPPQIKDPEIAGPPLIDPNRTNQTNADVAKANPNGRITMQRQADGTMSFSGNNVTGPVSYVDTKGNAAPGAGIRGNGFGQVLTAPAGNMVATDGNGNFAFSNELVNGRSGAAGQPADTAAAAGQARATAAGSPAPQAGWSGVIGGSTFGFDPAARNAEFERNKLVSTIMDGRTKRSQRQALTNLAQIASNDTNSFARLASEEERAAAGNQTALETTGMREQGEDYRASARNAIAMGELGVRASEATGAKQLRDVQLQAAQRAQGVTARYDAAKTDAERQSIMQMYPDVFGQKQAQPQGKDRYMTVGGGTSVVDGQTVREPTQVFDTVTQQYLGGQQHQQPLDANKQAQAIKDNPKLTREQKVAELQKLGYT